MPVTLGCEDRSPFEALSFRQKGKVLTERDSSITRRQLGRHLREAREAVGLTLADAANLMEWSRSSLQRIETGQNQKVRIRDLDGLIEIYGIENERAAGCEVWRSKPPRSRGGTNTAG